MKPLPSVYGSAVTGHPFARELFAELLQTSKTEADKVADTQRAGQTLPLRVPSRPFADQPMKETKP